MSYTICVKSIQSIPFEFSKLSPDSLLGYRAVSHGISSQSTCVKKCEFQLRDGQLLLSVKCTNKDTKENRGVSDDLVWDTLKPKVVAECNTHGWKFKSPPRCSHMQYLFSYKFNDISL